MIGIVAAMLLFIVVATYIGDLKVAYNEELTNTATTKGEDVTIVIPEGSSSKEIAKILKANGLIRFEKAFLERLQDSEYAGRLQAGTYTLNTGMNTLDMMAMMSVAVDSDSVLQKLVVPEGFTVDQIAERCEEQDICSAKEFKNACQSVTKADFSYLGDVPEGANVRYKVEGYLFPATYDITKDTTAESLVAWMLDTFKANYTEEMQNKATEMGLTSYDVVNRAAMIERECKYEQERPRIAGVINNRLDEDMKLQIDSTVLYPLTSGLYNKSEVTYDDLEIESPYNTYKYSGMPVGPICNPGLSCINAVLNPESHEYLYYHVINEETGEHEFYKTYEEHMDSQGGDDTESSDSDEGESSDDSDDE